MCVCLKFCPYWVVKSNELHIQRLKIVFIHPVKPITISVYFVFLGTVKKKNLSIKQLSNIRIYGFAR